MTLPYQSMDTAPKIGKIMLWLGAPYNRAAYAAWIPEWGVWHENPDSIDIEQDEIHGIGARVPVGWFNVTAPDVVPA